MKRYRKNRSNNVLKKLKENSELKRADVLTNFIKDEVERFSDAEVYTDDYDSEKRQGHWI